MTLVEGSVALPSSAVHVCDADQNNSFDSEQPLNLLQFFIRLTALK